MPPLCKSTYQYAVPRIKALTLPSEIKTACTEDIYCSMFWLMLVLFLAKPAVAPNSDVHCGFQYHWLSHAVWMAHAFHGALPVAAESQPSC